MIKVQDDERKDLARDLHDECGPALFMARVGIGELRKKLDKLSQSASFHEDWAIIDGTLDKLQQINRRILGRLRPAALEEVGLSGAVETMVQSWRTAHPNIALSCTLLQDHFVLDEHRALTAYRITQEALTNIYRHAHATQASVQIEEYKVEDKSYLKIIIADNGKGINLDISQGVGLRGMKERILSVEGELKIINNGSGTRIEAIIPLS
jgi:two-component system sensor histidine kinase UhpB